uniref:CDKN2A interacting protein n=1 Tax=Astyanax mexicanus TaxID=7994 RepID=A0A8B9R4E1_ASTMX
MSVFLSVSLSVCLSVYVFLSLHFFLSVCLFAFLFLSVQIFYTCFLLMFPAGPDAESCVKKGRNGPNDTESKAAERNSGRPVAAAAAKSGPPPGAVSEQQPFFNRLYKTVAWKLVSAGGFGPNLDHFEILRACVESCKANLSCVFVPLKDIPDLPAGCTQKEGQVCELRCQTVYMGTGYGRDDCAARAMASKEALKIFQGRKVTVKLARRRFRGRDVEDLVLLDEQPRSSILPPALSYPFQADQ